MGNEFSNGLLNLSYSVFESLEQSLNKSVNKSLKQCLKHCLSLGLSVSGMALACQELIAGALRKSIEEHGEGPILSILQWLHKSHALHVEFTKHGMFVKMHYTGRGVS